MSVLNPSEMAVIEESLADMIQRLHEVASAVESGALAAQKLLKLRELQGAANSLVAIEELSEQLTPIIENILGTMEDAGLTKGDRS